MIAELLVKTASAAGLVPCGGAGESACTNQEQFLQLGVNVINFMIHWLAFPLVLIFFLWGGFLLLTSGGSPNRVEQGKKAITGAVIGLIIVLTSVVVINTVLQFIVNPKVCKIDSKTKIISVGTLECPGLLIQEGK
ncbi:MAG: hypothetical protein WD889_03245 [Candidatus Colwellbacteria bacterium]